MHVVTKSSNSVVGQRPLSCSFSDQQSRGHVSSHAHITPLCPRVWNNLQSYWRQDVGYEQFETFLFGINRLRRIQFCQMIASAGYVTVSLCQGQSILLRDSDTHTHTQRVLCLLMLHRWTMKSSRERRFSKTLRVYVLSMIKYTKLHSVSQSYISHCFKTAKMKILWWYSIKNHIRKLLHLYTYIRRLAGINVSAHSLHSENMANTLVNAYLSSKYPYMTGYRGCGIQTKLRKGWICKLIGCSTTLHFQTVHDQGL